MSRASRALDVATGMSVGGLLAVVSLIFAGASITVVSAMVIGLGTVGGVIGYFWQTYYRL